MRPFSLNDEEIAHILHRRSLTSSQRDLVDYLAASLAGAQPPLATFPANVVPLQRSCPGKH